jgi:O-antigen/teichoic acid export membrane protein
VSRDLAGYARSGAWSLVAQAVHLAGTVAASIVIVRGLGEADWGLLSVVRQVTALATVLSGLALERTTLRFLPELLETQGAAVARRFFWVTLLLRVLAWLPLLGITWLLRNRLEELFHAPLGGWAVVGVATALVYSLYNHIRGAATARFATRRVALATALGSVVGLLATVAVLEAGWGITGVLVATAAGILAAALLLLGTAAGRGNGGEGSGIGVEHSRFLRFALPFAGIAVLNYVVHSATEVLFLGHFQGPVPAGHFQLGFTFSQRLVDFLPLALWEVSMAGFSRITVLSPERLPAAMRSYLVLTYLAMAPLVCLGVAFSPAAIRILYGEAMLPAALVSQSYFAMAAYATLGAPIGFIVYARERVGQALRAYVVFAVVNVGLDLLLIPRMGLWGGILAMGAAKMVAVLLMARIARREMTRLEVPWGFLGRAFAASLPVLLWLALDERWPGPGPAVLAGLVSLPLLVLSFRLWRVVGPAEADLIRATRLPLRGVALRLLATGA